MSIPQNPLRRGLVEDRTGDACAVVIFGASGDLTKRKLMPALYNLGVSRSLPGGFAPREKAAGGVRGEVEEGLLAFPAPKADRSRRVGRLRARHQLRDRAVR